MIYLALALFPIAIIALNIWYYRHRRRLTPEQRAAMDEAIREDTQAW